MLLYGNDGTNWINNGTWWEEFSGGGWGGWWSPLYLHVIQVQGNNPSISWSWFQLMLQLISSSATPLDEVSFMQWLIDNNVYYNAKGLMATGRYDDNTTRMNAASIFYAGGNIRIYVVDMPTRAWYNIDVDLDYVWDDVIQIGTGWWWGGGGPATWWSITGSISAQTDLMSTFIQTSEIVQTIGTSVTNVMSQKATTDAINNAKVDMSIETLVWQTPAIWAKFNYLYAAPGDFTLSASGVETGNRYYLKITSVPNCTMTLDSSITNPRRLDTHIKSWDITDCVFLARDDSTLELINIFTHTPDYIMYSSTSGTFRANVNTLDSEQINATQYAAIIKTLNWEFYCLSSDATILYKIWLDGNNELLLSWMPSVSPSSWCSITEWNNYLLIRTNTSGTGSPNITLYNMDTGVMDSSRFLGSASYCGTFPARNRVSEPYLCVGNGNGSRVRWIDYNGGSPTLWTEINVGGQVRQWCYTFYIWGNPYAIASRDQSASADVVWTDLSIQTVGMPATWMWMINWSKINDMWYLQPYTMWRSLNGHGIFDVSSGLPVSVYQSTAFQAMIDCLLDDPELGKLAIFVGLSQLSVLDLNTMTEITNIPISYNIVRYNVCYKVGNDLIIIWLSEIIKLNLKDYTIKTQAISNDAQLNFSYDR